MSIEEFVGLFLFTGALNARGGNEDQREVVDRFLWSAHLWLFSKRVL